MHVWSDEAYTFALIKHSFSEICTITAADVHPPLYYVLLKIFIAPFNYSLLAAKLFSIVPYVLILVIGGIQMQRLFDEKRSLVFMLLFLFFPFSLKYAVEIRMYSLASLFVFINAVYAYRCYEKNTKKDWCIFVLGGVGACYTHYFAMVSVGIIYFLLFVFTVKKNKQLLKRWLISMFVTVLLYLPWLKYFVGQLVYKINNDYWIGPITFKTVVDYLITIFGANGMKTFALFSSFAYFLVFLYVILSHDRRDNVLSLCSLAVPVGTILLGVVISLLVRPVFIIKYVIPAVPLLIVFITIGIGQIRREALLAMIFTIFFMGGISNYGTRLYEEYKTVENVLDNTFTEEYAYCDSYVYLIKSSHLRSILTYYETQKPIYVKKKTGGASPFDNLVSMDEFDSNANKQILVLVDVGGEVPEVLSDLYQCEYIEKVYGWEGDGTADVYLLTER